MALKRTLALLVLALAFAAPARAGDTPLVQMHFFEGCWRGVFADQPGVSDERCFTPMLGGTYLRDTHTVHGGGAYAGESIYYLDAQAHKLAYTYYAADGGMSRGFLTADGQGGLVFEPGAFVDADGSTLTLRATWRTHGADRYTAETEVQENGRWRVLMRIDYTRAPDLRPPPP